VNATIAQLSGEFICNLDYASLPQAVVHRSRRLMIDFLVELAVADRQSNLIKGFSRYLESLVEGEDSYALGTGIRSRSTEAAMSMGILGHSLELDDGHRWGTAHPAAAVMPAVFAEADLLDSSLDEVLVAVVAGYEVMLRLARLINPSSRDRGFHTTGTCGTVGAAAAVARIRRLSASQSSNAIALGALQSCGLQVMLADEPGIKPLQAGHASRTGVLCARLADNGVQAPMTVFEGQYGWLRAFSDESQFDPMEFEDFGTRWELLNVYTKLYPSCRHCHTAIDLMREAKRELQFDPDQIEVLQVDTYSVAVHEVGQIREPRSLQEAMFSLAGTIAITAKTGNLGLRDLRMETWLLASLTRLMRLIDIRIDPEIDANYPAERGAKLRLQLSDGRRFEKLAVLPRGEPEMGVSDHELEEKFRSMDPSAEFAQWVAHLWKVVVEAELSQTKYRGIVQIFEDRK